MADRWKPSDAELLQWLAKTCEERYPYRNGETYIADWRPTDDTVRPVGYGVLRALNEHINKLRGALLIASERLSVAAARVDRADTEFGFRQWADEARAYAGDGSATAPADGDKA